MKIYFAGAVPPYSEAVVKHGGQALLSYADSRAVIKFLQNHPGEKIFLDSGAFTAFTQGKQINIHEYMQFIDENKDRFETYATLDVIGDWRATEKNTQLMESQGLQPLPVFHYQSPEEELKRLMDKYEYFALGGLVPLARLRKKLQSWLDYCFSVIKINNKVHGLGMTGDWCLKRYPFYTVDSTSYLQSSRFGQSHFIKDDRITTFNNKTKHYLDRTEIEVINTIKRQNQITKLWESRGVKWD